LLDWIRKHREGWRATRRTGNTNIPFASKTTNGEAANNGRVV